MKRPQVHIWAIIYFIFGTASFLFLCLWAIRDGWFPSERVLWEHPDSTDSFYGFNKSLAVISGVLTIFTAIPAGIIILGKRKSWVWMTILIFIALGIPIFPLMGIPVVIFWIMEKNKEYYGRGSCKTPCNAAPDGLRRGGFVK
jgi:hypothetical protein